MIKEVSKLTFAMYRSYLPESKKNKREILKLAQKHIDHLKPQIEEYFQEELQDIEARDMNSFAKDVALSWGIENGFRLAKKEEKEINPNDIRISTNFYYATLLPIQAYIQLRNITSTVYKHRSDAIYIPFGFSQRLGYRTDKNHFADLDYIVTHEIIHNIWDKKRKPHNAPYSLSKKIGEGYATATTDEFFQKHLQKPSPQPKTHHYTYYKESLLQATKEVGIQDVREVPKHVDEIKDAFARALD